jgi:phosphatidylethanolamine-binding protein (PEBP) family uncharacterized protein
MHDAPPAITMMPTLEPTVEPTVEPTAKPTAQPTLPVPTGVPTTPMPTYKTNAPSFAPTRFPIKYLDPNARKEASPGPSPSPLALGNNIIPATTLPAVPATAAASYLQLTRTTEFTTTATISSSNGGVFTLASPLGDYMGSQYTCTDADGNLRDGTSPPMEFINPPAGTAQYLLTMSSVYGKTGTEKFNWVVYGIAGDAAGIDEGCTAASCGAGTIGGTYPGEPVEYKYKAPCASVSGVHSITFTLYAFSGDITPYVVPGETDKMPELLQIAEDHGYVLGQTTTSLSYCTCYCDADDTRRRDRSLREGVSSSIRTRTLDTFCEK